MREYEVLYIAHPDLEGDRLKEVVDKFSGIVAQNGGEVLKIEEWGKQKLAYPVEKCSKGQYVLMNVAAPSTLTSELERNLRLDELVLKYLTVKISDQVDVEARKKEIAASRAKSEERSPRPAVPPSDGQDAGESPARPAAETADAETNAELS